MSFSLMKMYLRHSLYLGAIGELVRRKIDFAKRSLAYEATQCVISDRPELFRREFSVETNILLSNSLLMGANLTPADHCRNWQAGISFFESADVPVGSWLENVLREFA